MSMSSVTTGGPLTVSYIWLCEPNVNRYGCMPSVTTTLNNGGLVQSSASTLCVCCTDLCNGVTLDCDLPPFPCSRSCPARQPSHPETTNPTTSQSNNNNGNYVSHRNSGPPITLSFVAVFLHVISCFVVYRCFVRS